MSYILIDSKNYSNKRTYVGGIIPQPADEHNIIQNNLRGGLPIQNVYVSMVQDFGVRLDNEPVVIVEPITLAPRTTRPRNTLKQLKIILKGIDDNTYECLKNRHRESEKEGTDTDREAARTHIAELRNSRVGYLESDYEKLSKKQKLVFHGVADSLPLIFGHEDEIGMSEEWSREQCRIREEMQE
jgi:hypothetical protein